MDAGRALRAPVVGLLLTVLFWAGNFTASKVALAEIPPMPFTAVRFALGSLILWAILVVRERQLLPPPGTILPLVALGLVGNTLYQLCFINGLALTTATNSALILAGMPTVVTVAGGLLGLETTTTRERMGLAVATLGVVFVVSARKVGAVQGSLQGDLLTVLAVLFWAGYTLGLRVLKGRMSALALTTWTLITGTPGLVVAGVPGLLRQDWGAVTAAGWSGLAYSTLLSLVAAYVLWNRAVARLGPARTVLFSLLTPLVATLIAMVVLHERPTAVHAVGGAMIVAGVVLSRLRVRGAAPAPPGGPLHGGGVE